MSLLFTVIRAAIRTLFMRKQALLLENLALRQQLAAYRRTSERARLRPSDRVFWVGLSSLWDGWPSALVIVKPETVIRWHRKGFRLFWRRKSRSGKVGRPRIPRRHIAFIKRMIGVNCSCRSTPTTSAAVVSARETLISVRCSCSGRGAECPEMQQGS